MVFGLKGKTSGYAESFQSVDSSESELFELEDRDVRSTRDHQPSDGDAAEPKRRSRSRSAARKIAATVAKLAGKLKSETLSVEPSCSDAGDEDAPPTRRLWMGKSGDNKKSTSMSSEPDGNSGPSILECKIANDRPSRLPAPSRSGFEEEDYAFNANATKLSAPTSETTESDDDASDHCSVVSNAVQMLEKRKTIKSPRRSIIGRPDQSPYRSRSLSRSRKVANQRGQSPTQDGDPDISSATQTATCDANIPTEPRPAGSPTKLPCRRLRSKTPEVRRNKGQATESTTVKGKHSNPESFELSTNDTESEDSDEDSSYCGPRDKRGLLDTSNHSSFRVSTSITGILKGSNHGKGISSKWGNSSWKPSDHDGAIESSSAHSHSAAEKDDYKAEIDEELERCLIANMSASASNLATSDSMSLVKDVQEWRENRLRASKVGTTDRGQRGCTRKDSRDTATSDQSNVEEASPEHTRRKSSEHDRRSRESSNLERTRGRSRGSKHRSKSIEDGTESEKTSDHSRLHQGVHDKSKSSSRSSSSSRIRGSSNHSIARSSHKERSKSKARSDKDEASARSSTPSEESVPLTRAKSDHTRSGARLRRPSGGISTSEHVQSSRGSSSSKTQQALDDPVTPVSRRTNVSRKSPSVRRLKLSNEYHSTPTKARQITEPELGRHEGLMPELTINENDGFELDLLPHATPKSERACLRTARTPTSHRSRRMNSKSPKPVKSIKVVDGLAPTTANTKQNGEVGSNIRSTSRQASERRMKSKTSRSSSRDGPDESNQTRTRAKGHDGEDQSAFAQFSVPVLTNESEDASPLGSVPPIPVA